MIRYRVIQCRSSRYMPQIKHAWWPWWIDMFSRESISAATRGHVNEMQTVEQCEAYIRDDVSRRTAAAAYRMRSEIVVSEFELVRREELPHGGDEG